jgi:hypothetical protein
MRFEWGELWRANLPYSEPPRKPSPSVQLCTS